MALLTDPFHAGIIVADVEEAMAQLSASDGLSWHSVQGFDLNLLVDGEVVTTSVRFTYSVEGPLQIELAQGPQGSFWDANQYGGLNHLGYWTEDLHGDIRALQAGGCEVIYGGASDDGGLEGFAFLAPPTTGQRIELIDVAMRPAFDRWFAGGDFA
ncbi:VOC family protein [Candidatus Poriferisocius sp.]|uniref:VOC family protein n=1 Tax=Candidatus Poriferisocius sp. TaxID=3101276 RepID=UPI003B5CD029